MSKLGEHKGDARDNFNNYSIHCARHEHNYDRFKLIGLIFQWHGIFMFLFGKWISRGVFVLHRAYVTGLQKCWPFQFISSLEKQEPWKKYPVSRAVIFLTIVRGCFKQIFKQILRHVRSLPCGTVLAGCPFTICWIS